MTSSTTSSITSIHDTAHESYRILYRQVLSRTISTWHIVFMIFNIVFGISYFQNTTYSVIATGPGYGSIAFIVVGVIALCVAISIAEMLRLFPITCPIYELPSSFIDRDFGLILGIGYWLSYTILLNTLVISALNLLNLQTEVHYGLLPVFSCVIMAINYLPVYRYGQVEAAIAILKLLAIFALIVLTIAGAARSGVTASSSQIPLFKSKDGSAIGHVESMCTAMILALPAYIGIESIATMSAEARSTTRTIPSTKVVSGFVAVVCFPLMWLFWAAQRSVSDDNFARYTTQGFGSLVSPPEKGLNGRSNVPALIAILTFERKAQHAANALLIFSALSAANTALYTASRTLFSIFSGPKFRTGVPKRLFGKLGNVDDRNRVPVVASIVTFLAVIPISILNMFDSGRYLCVAQLATNMAISTCLVVWASQCLAFIRFDHFRRRYQEYLPRKFSTHSSNREVHCNRFHLQPFAAWLGFIGCMTILFCCTTAVFWNGTIPADDRIWAIAGFYISPSIVATIYLTIKVIRATIGSHKPVFDFYVQFKDPSHFQITVADLLSKIHPLDYRVDADTFPTPASMAIARLW